MGKDDKGRYVVKNPAEWTQIRILPTFGTIEFWHNMSLENVVSHQVGVEFLYNIYIKQI